MTVVQYIKKNIYWTLQVKEIQMCAEKYLKEFDGSSELQILATKVLKDLKNMYTQLHEEWCRDLQVIYLI